MADKLRIAGFVSGGGTNLQAILDGCEDGTIHGEVVVVVSNNPEAHGLKRAKRHGVPTVALDHQHYATREDHERAILAAIEPYGPQVAVLAGYMRVITPLFIDHFHDRVHDRPGVLNIHPADTRQYQGAHGYEFAMGLLETHPQRLAETKITVHFVDPGVDTGPIIAQRPVPVRPTDTLDDLRARGLAVEHQLYPEVLELYARGKLDLVDGQVVIQD